MKKAKLIESKIRKKSKLRGFITPDYEKYCVSNIPNTVLSILGVKNKGAKIPKNDIKSQTKDIKRVIIFLIDSLGYNHFLRFVRKNKKSIFNKMIKRGEFFPLTSVFPSITPVVLSTYINGLTPQEHGIVSSSFYHEKIKKVINVLHFRTSEEIPIELKFRGIKPKDLLKAENIFEKMKKEKIISFLINYKEFIGSEFNEMLYRGSKEIAYTQYKDLFKNLNKVLKKSNKVFVLCYFYRIDEIIHDYGNNSKLLFKELDKISKRIEYFVKSLDSKTAKETMIIICSDHGQIDLSKKKMVYLKDYPKIMENISNVPMGGIRNVFLKVKKNKRKELEKYLKREFNTKALILNTKGIERKKLLGLKKITKKNHQRIGDLLILPYKNYSFIAPLKEHQSFIKAQHGGLSQEEMLIPFVCVKLSNLKN